MALKVFNTLSRKKEIFRPFDEKNVKMFVCGVTEYDYVHLGHARTYAFYDTLARYLRYLGFNVTYLQNITDVGHLLDTGEDRILQKAEEEVKDPMEIVEFFLKHHLQAFDKMRFLRPDIMKRATHHIKEIIDQIQTLITNEFAYVANGSVYFEVSQFKNYGQLSNKLPKELRAGARVKVNPDKKDPCDFALWIKAPPNHILKWNSPWGVGYPGWHIEDTAIAMKYFGPQYDIHGGAIELTFPHHEAEIAQAEATTGIKPYVKYWIHTGLLTIDKVKMAKSLGNYIRLIDALDKYSPETLRLWIGSTHYRKPLDYNETDLESASKKIERISDMLERIENALEGAKDSSPVFVQNVEQLRREFFEAMNDNMNTSLALSRFFEIISTINKQIDLKNFAKRDLTNAKDIIHELGQFFQIVPETRRENIPKEIEELIKRRAKFKRRKDWEKADAIRAELMEKGIILEDTQNGVKWKIRRKK